MPEYEVRIHPATHDRASYVWEVRQGDMLAETGMADDQEEAARLADSWIAAHRRKK